jgi:ADP-ribose pyrophosphatase YjhB (NUDIX family)
MGLALDPDLNFPIIHRGPAVRSAKNCWSLPSGLHENGVTCFEQMAIEFKEELNIDVVSYNHVYLGYYENIAVVDSYHWVIHVYAMLADLSNLENKEPHKHDKVQLCNVRTFDEQINGLVWSPGLKPFLQRHFKPAPIIELVEAELKVSQ